VGGRPSPEWHDQPWCRVHSKVHGLSGDRGVLGGGGSQSLEASVTGPLHGNTVSSHSFQNILFLQHRANRVAALWLDLRALCVGGKEEEAHRWATFLRAKAMLPTGLVEKRDPGTVSAHLESMSQQAGCCLLSAHLDRPK
jgi:hypothetical protein